MFQHDLYEERVEAGKKEGKDQEEWKLDNISGISRASSGLRLALSETVAGQLVHQAPSHLIFIPVMQGSFEKALLRKYFDIC